MTQTKRTGRPIASKTLCDQAEDMARTSLTHIEGTFSKEVHCLIDELQIHPIDLKMQSEYRASLTEANLAISPVDTGGMLITCKFLRRGVRG